MSKDKNPKRNARREAKQRRRVPPDAVCCFCGEDDPRALQQHHVMGRAHEPDLTITSCLNDHAKATDGQFQEDVPLSATDNLFDRVAAIFDALAAFFRFLADSFNQLAEQVRSSMGKLDAEHPEWRSTLSEGS
jgi:hypothetical protein